MAQINFPTATSNGQEFEADNGVLYTYVGTPPNGFWSGNTQDGLSGLDGRFLKLDGSNDPVTGNLDVNGVVKSGGDAPTSQGIKLNNGQVQAAKTTGTDPVFSGYTAGNSTATSSITAAGNASFGAGYLEVSSSQVLINGSEPWTAGNDGATSGLDADLLDGQQGNYYLDYSNFTNTPSIPTNNNQLTNGAGYITSAQVAGTNLGIIRATTNNQITSSTGNNVTIPGASSTEAGLMTTTEFTKLSGIESGATNTLDAAITSNGSTPSLNSGISAAEVRSLIGAGDSSFSGSYNDLTNKPTIPTNNNQLTNGAGYITSADGGNAATLGGKSGNTANVANTVVLRDANGSSGFNDINVAANDVTSGVTKICVETGNDGWIKHGDAGSVRSFLNVANGAEVNVQSDWNATSGDALILNKPTIPTNNNQLTNGAGYITSADGGNADTVDGLHASSFLRTDVNTTKTSGELLLNDNVPIRFGTGGDAQMYHNGSDMYFDFQVSGDSWYFRDEADSTIMSIAEATGDVNLNKGNLNIWYQGTQMGDFSAQDTSFLRINQNTVKNIFTPRYIRADSGFFVDGTTKGIDGSGNFIGGTISGASDYSTLLRSNANDEFTGIIENGGNFVSYAGSASAASFNKLRLGRNGTQFMSFMGDSTGNLMASISPSSDAKANLRFGYSVDGGASLAATYTLSGSTGTIWHSGNDGSGSGLDADTLDGAQPSSSASNSTIVKRNSSGYIYANYFNTSPNTVTSGVTQVCVETGNDGFIRHGTQAAIREFIGAGSGNGLDADTLDGEQLDDSAATGNTVVGRNGSGDIHVRLTRQTYADQSTISGGLVYRVNNSSDNYLRVCNSPAAIRTFLGVNEAGSIPQNGKTSAYTLVATDAGKHISITTGGVTVPSGVFSVGDAVTIFNNSTNNQTITQGTSALLRIPGTLLAGSRTLAQYGLCTILCVASNVFVISGAGVS